MTTIVVLAKMDRSSQGLGYDAVLPLS